MKPHEELAQAMQARRLELDLTWKELAAAAGISVEALGAIRRGKNKPGDLTARGLDKAFQWEYGTVLSYYAEEEQRGSRRASPPQSDLDDDDDIDLDTFVPQTPREQALWKLYQAREKEKADKLERQLQDFGEKLAEHDRKIQAIADRVEPERESDSQKSA